MIQKEFAGFSDTHERLDLLALDKQGSLFLFLLKNKLDDTGRDLTWQALKYASYCSGLSKENVRQIYQEFLDKTDPGGDAKERMTEFLDADDQRGSHRQPRDHATHHPDCRQFPQRGHVDRPVAPEF